MTSTPSTGKRPAPEGSIAFVTDAGGATATEIDPLAGLGAVASGPGKGMLLSDTLVAINASGLAAGTSAVTVTSGTKTTTAAHAVRLSGGTLTDLGTLGGMSSEARGINAAGLVVGVSDLGKGKGKAHAFSSNGATMTDLGTLGGDLSVATAVNDAGTIVGGSSSAKRAVHPFTYAGGAMTDLGLPTGFSDATATAIASGGGIVGFGDVPPTATKGKKGAPAIRSFLYASGAYTILPSLYVDDRGDATPVRAEGVNASGTVVGGTLDASGKPKAFVYEGGAMTDLTTLLPTAYAGWTVVDATGITDTGYVSAVGLDAGGKSYALLLQLG